MSELLVSRRRLLGAGALGAGALALPAWARGADLHGNESIRPGFDEVSGRDIALTIGEGPRVVQGRRGHAIAVNGSGSDLSQSRSSLRKFPFTPAP